MKKKMFGFLWFAGLVISSSAWAQDAGTTVQNWPLSNILSNNFNPVNPQPRLPVAAVQAAGDVGTALFSVLPDIMAARRSYTPPIDLTTVLSAQY